MKFVILLNPHDADKCAIAQVEHGQNVVFDNYNDACVARDKYVSVKARVITILEDEE